MKAAQVRQSMEDLKTFIQDSDAKVRGGTMVDLSGLESKVTMICTKATSLPPKDAMDIQPLMADLIGELERLTISLRDFRDDLQR